MQRDTSWQKVSDWYGKITKDGGHYYHSHVVLPGVMRLIGDLRGAKLLDLACGNGVLARILPKGVEYLGVDLSSDLIGQAKTWDKNPAHKYMLADVTKPLKLGVFTHATIILALQNMKDPEGAIANMSLNLTDGGIGVIVINHPSFRIPRQSAWGEDENSKLQYRRVNRYMSIMEIPVTAHPGAKNSPLIWSYHYPLSAYSQMFYDNGLLIEKIEEWTSDKISVGKAARMENRARKEFPLFMALKLRKNDK